MANKQIGLKAGTYNTPIIVGLGKACENINKQFDEKIYSLSTSKDTIIEYCENINFKGVKSAPQTFSNTVLDAEADGFKIYNNKNFAASTESACNSRIIEDEYVLKEVRISKNNKIIRFSLL